MARKGSSGPGLFGRDVIRVLKGQSEQRNVRQVDLAIAAAISPSQVSRIFSFEKEMTVDNLEGFCLALDIEMVRIIELAQDKRVWATRDHTYVDGYNVAADSITDEGRYRLAQKEGDRTRKVIESVFSTTENSGESSVINLMKHHSRPDKHDGIIHDWDHSLDNQVAADSSPDEDTLREREGSDPID